jgi:hypothetical protein
MEHLEQCPLGAGSVDHLRIGTDAYHDDADQWSSLHRTQGMALVSDGPSERAG